MTKTVRVQCPICESDNVSKLDCGGYAWLRCNACRNVWDEDLEERERHKKRKAHEEAPLTE